MTQFTFRRCTHLCACILLMLGLVAACGGRATETLPKVEVFVLMSAHDFAEVNQHFMAVSQQQVEAETSLASIESSRPVAFE